jgi:hypothetical protein
MIVLTCEGRDDSQRLEQEPAKAEKSADVTNNDAIYISGYHLNSKGKFTCNISPPVSSSRPASPSQALGGVCRVFARLSPCIYIPLFFRKKTGVFPYSSVKSNVATSSPYAEGGSHGSSRHRSHGCKYTGNGPSRSRSTLLYLSCPQAFSGRHVSLRPRLSAKFSALPLSLKRHATHGLPQRLQEISGQSAPPRHPCPLHCDSPRNTIRADNIPHLTNPNTGPPQGRNFLSQPSQIKMREYRRPTRVCHTQTIASRPRRRGR